MTQEASKAGPDREHAELMYVRCSNCGAWMDVKPGQASSVSHSICPQCLEKELRKLDHEDRAAATTGR